MVSACGAGMIAINYLEVQQPTVLWGQNGWDAGQFRVIWSRLGARMGFQLLRWLLGLPHSRGMGSKKEHSKREEAARPFQGQAWLESSVLLPLCFIVQSRPRPSSQSREKMHVQERTESFRAIFGDWLPQCVYHFYFFFCEIPVHFFGWFFYWFVLSLFGGDGY